MKTGDKITAINPKSKYLTNGKDYEIKECRSIGYPDDPLYVYVWLIGDNGKKRCFALKTVINK